MVTAEENTTIERMIEEGQSAIAIRAAVPNVSRTNVYLKIAKFKKHGTVGRVQTKTLGRPRVMSEGVDKFLQGLLAAKPDMELEEMRRHMQDQLHITVSMSTISRAITRAGISNGRFNRVRTSTRRKNKVVPTTDPLEEAEDQQIDSELDAQPGHEGTIANHIPTPVGETSWDYMPHSAPHHLQDPHQHPQSMMHPSHHSMQDHEMHVLDPSLAQAYPAPAGYHSIYADLSRGGQHPALTMHPVSQPNMEVYRSPYAPL